MLKWILGAVLGVILGIAGYLFWYLGAFKPVLIAEIDPGPMTFLYQEHIGAYHKIAPLISEVETWAQAHKLECFRTFGEYFDDPRSVEEGRLRSRGGCLVNPTAVAEANDLPANFKIAEIPPRSYVSAVFEGSPAIGPFKVYPKVEDYFVAKKTKIAGAVIEIYEVHSQKAMTTTYLFPQ